MAAPQAFGGGQTVDNSGAQFWDTVVNLRIDQSWGYAAVSGAIHQNGGGYYNNAINSTNAAMANTVVQGHPGDSYGWAGSAGFLLTDFLGLKGDTLAFATQYGHGAVGYVFKSPGTYFLAGNGNKIAFGNTLDGVFANGTGVDMSDAFSAWMGFEHFWTPKLHTAFQGGVAGISYNNGAKSLMCAGAPGFAANPNNALGFAYANSTGSPAGLHQRLGSGLAVQPELRLVAGRYADHLEPASRPRYRRRSDVPGDPDREPRGDGLAERCFGRHGSGPLQLRERRYLVGGVPHPAQLPALILNRQVPCTSPRQQCRGFSFGERGKARVAARVA